MRHLAVASIVVALAATIAADQVSELTGTVRVGAKPQVDAVVWLDAADAPLPATPARAVLDAQPDVQSPRAGRTGRHHSGGKVSRFFVPTG